MSDAAALLRNSEDGMILAGGQTLIPAMKQRLASPSDLIDLSGDDTLKRIFVKKTNFFTLGLAPYMYPA